MIQFIPSEGGRGGCEAFDQPATIVRLGTKLFTRIRNEDQRALIRKFLAENGRKS